MNFGMNGRLCKPAMGASKRNYPIERLFNPTNETLSPVLDQTVSLLARFTSYPSIDPERTATSCHRRAIGCVRSEEHLL
ncbi:hypothetical protein Y032_0073g750 [Ancylostoma ceylanicum]|uniref:Uncharacterized protein n=1 Tax=Ancylostoma ceylanicum TaxID=53326 RepID=A0A016TVU5_9BILA|nr:hypothetical protein Y032_0073g750 [Ancylostoma ceylanicum]